MAPFTHDDDAQGILASIFKEAQTRSLVKTVFQGMAVKAAEMGYNPSDLLAETASQNPVVANAIGASQAAGSSASASGGGSNLLEQAVGAGASFVGGALGGKTSSEKSAPKSKSKSKSKPKTKSKRVKGRVKDEFGNDMFDVDFEEDDDTLYDENESSEEADEESGYEEDGRDDLEEDAEEILYDSQAANKVYEGVNYVVTDLPQRRRLHVISDAQGNVVKRWLSGGPRGLRINKR